MIICRGRDSKGLPMLLAIDIGNTSITFGLFEGKRLTRHWRLSTRLAGPKNTKRSISRNIPGRERKVEGVCISSVVPRLNPIMKNTLKKSFCCPVFFVSSKNSGIKIRNYNPLEVGADRLVNAVAGLKKYGKPLIVVDFGTATTFDYVNKKGEYAGGAISPGIELANRALFEMTAKLPLVKIRKPGRVLGQKTKESMQSGLFHGYVGLIDHLVNEIKKETRSAPKVIATGGLASLISPFTKTIRKVEPDLTLQGLRIIWEKNHRQKQPA